jgi:23S rRNA (cytosine1962-C5)-methyltransferase
MPKRYQKLVAFQRYQHPRSLQLARDLDTLSAMNQEHLDKQIVLKKKEDRRIVAGHQWVFSNEIQEIRGGPGLGEVAELLTAGGRSLGVGFYNPHSLIALRLLSRTIVPIDEAFFHRRLEQALRLREVLYPGADAYRLVHGESDFLPGLIVDRFRDTLVIQALSYGMDVRLPIICDVLESLCHPLCIVERNESPLRALESLPDRRGTLRGSAHTVEIEEHGLRYSFNPLEGQKTGFFLDQRENRILIRRFSPRAAVLDCFCNDGGFALNAARGGATSVLGLDSSEDAVRRATTNARLNGLDQVRFERADVFERLSQLKEEASEFDLVILDPPSFTKSRKNVQSAKRGYRELHGGALRVLRKGGILVSASCSHHIEPDVFAEVIDQSARHAGRSLQLLEWRGAAPDHPVLPSLPETRYLKLGIYRVL